MLKTICIASFFFLVFALTSATAGQAEPRAAHGAKKWSFAAEKSIGGVALSRDGTIYVGLYSGAVCALGPDGKTNWTFRSDSPVSRVAVAGDDTIYACSQGGTLYALNGKGKEIKKKDITMLGEVESVAVGVDGTVYSTSIYDSFNGPEIHQRATKADGTFLWENPFSHDEPVDGFVASSKGPVYGTTHTGELYTVGAEGKLTIVTTIDHPINAISIDPAGIIYIGAEDMVYAFAPDGKAIWPSAVGNLSGTSKVEDRLVTALTATRGATIYAGLSDGSVYAIASKDRRSSLIFKCGSLGTAIAVSSDGTLYVATRNGLYAITFG